MSRNTPENRLHDCHERDEMVTAKVEGEIDENGEIVGLTEIGSTTAYVLGINSEIRRQIRLAMIQLGAEG